MSFKVIVAENSHYMNDNEYWDAGSFGALEEAIAKAKQIVDTSLEEAVRAGGSEQELYEHYIRWGCDPFIKAIDEPQDGVTFSAWTYARERCAWIANQIRTAP